MAPTVEEIDFIVEGLCLTASYEQLFRFALLNDSARRSVILAIKKRLPKSSLICIYGSDAPLLVQSEEPVIERQKVVRIRCIEISTKTNRCIALWKLRSIGNCFTLEHPYVVKHEKKRCVTWSGWWTNSENCKWITLSGEHIRSVSDYIVVNYEGNTRMVSNKRFQELASLCKDDEEAEDMLKTLRQLRPGDVFYSREDLFSVRHHITPERKLYTVFAVPHSECLSCTAHCTLDRGHWTVGNGFRCGLPHKNQLRKQSLIVHDVRRRTSSLPPCAFLKERSGFSFISVGDGNYSCTVPSPTLQSKLGMYVSMKKDPCKTVFKVTKTLFLDGEAEMLRLTDVGNCSVEHIVPLQKLKNDFYIMGDKYELQHNMSLFRTRCMNQLPYLCPGDVVGMTGHEHCMRISLMITKPDGTRLFSCKCTKDNSSFSLIELDGSNVYWTSKVTDADSLYVKAKAKEVKLGDLVVISRNRRDDFYFVNRIISHAVSGGTYEAIVVAMQLQNGDLVELLERQLGRISAISHDIPVVIAQLSNYKSHVSRSLFRRKL